MERLTGGERVPDTLRGGIIALGNFDGFHIGHQAVVGHAVKLAHAQGRPAIVATFDPHPVHYFHPDMPPFRLTTLDQRQQLFKAAGADAMLVLHFDETLANVTADSFVREWLVGQTGTTGVVTGEDFTFGKGREGSVASLKGLGAPLGMACETVGPVSEGGQAVSSSRIRQALQGGDCTTATRLLTRAFAVRSVVQDGDKVGRQLGYPTANLDMGDYLRPRYGIYAVRARLPDGRLLDGVANLGIRPSFDPPKELLEPYFFDFTGDLYGLEIAVELIEFLRGEAKFDDMELLKAQMARDCDAARIVLRR
ncbi:bifunctional riboflavin kinase/FAD synthetase [Sphingomonas sp.]|uniref:bifunctional riboflavin kinase/FAD synthetase n=1 Tax=Sphingomonas sp. TaxID=28214 RepID=UPI0025D1F62B|nr:bifunctional riboflavin kinase/FAD synthetase [Sphingomonas sp.]